MKAIIYKPSRAATQSGKMASEKWLLKFSPEQAQSINPLTRWIRSNDTRSQITLRFDSKQQAIAYAERHNIPYKVTQTHKAKPVATAYSDNFAANRHKQWTH